MNYGSAMQATTTWRKTPLSRRSKPGDAIAFDFAPAYVRALWNPPATGTRGRAQISRTEAEQLLLDDVILIEGASGFARAWLVPTTKPEHYSLKVELVSPRRHTRNARVQLQWGNQRFGGILRAGQMLFENISTPDFSRLYNNLPGYRVRLTFEFEGNANGRN